MREVVTARHRELVQIEMEIRDVLAQPPHLRRPVQLLWQISRGRAGITAKRQDSLLEMTIELTGPNAAALAQCIQRFTLGAAAQRGELTQHDADGWRSLIAERDELRRRLEHATHATVPNLLIGDGSIPSPPPFADQQPPHPSMTTPACQE